jgi:hypothetical protein
MTIGIRANLNFAIGVISCHHSQYTRAVSSLERQNLVRRFGTSLSHRTDRMIQVI